VVLGLAEYVKPRNEELDPQLIREFMLFTNDLDHARGQSFAEAHGELKELLRDAGFDWTHETLHANAANTTISKVPQPVSGSTQERSQAAI
jgi:hypothetical protein